MAIKLGWGIPVGFDLSTRERPSSDLDLVRFMVITFILMMFPLSLNSTETNPQQIEQVEFELKPNKLIFSIKLSFPLLFHSTRVLYIILKCKPNQTILLLFFLLF